MIFYTDVLSVYPGHHDAIMVESTNCKRPVSHSKNRLCMTSNPDRSPAVNRCVAMLHVEDVDAACEFYQLLGFKVESRYVREDRVTNFVGLKSGQAEVFLALSSGPIVPSQQAVLFYMYASDVHGLRDHLIAHGLEDGGIPPGLRKRGHEGHMPERRAVYSICNPFYMPHGELRVQDPDGYTILVGQLEP